MKVSLDTIFSVRSVLMEKSKRIIENHYSDDSFVSRYTSSYKNRAIVYVI